MQKFQRRLKEEPLIPLGTNYFILNNTHSSPTNFFLFSGCAATCYALFRAYRSMKAKDSQELNRMFRARIYAQFFTLFAVVAGGMYYKTERTQRREFERMVEERKSREKRDAWLRELEVRDQEDKGWRERHAAAAEAAKEVDKPKEKSGLDKNQSPVEDVERKGLGVLDAVKELVAKKN